MGDWIIERLDRSHDRAGFQCGKPALDEFIRRLVSQYEKRRLGRIFVAVRAGEKKVCGYYTLAAGTIPFQSLPEGSARKLPKHPVPVVLLARLAVDQSARGEGLGEALLVCALERCVQLADGIGVYAIDVDAIDEQAITLYAKYGFVPLIDRERHVFLSIDTARDAFPSHHRRCRQPTSRVTNASWAPFP